MSTPNVTATQLLYGEDANVGPSGVSKSQYTIVTVVGIVVAVVLAGVSIYNVIVLNKAMNQPKGKSGVTVNEAKAGRIISIVCVVLGIVIAGFYMYEWFRPSLLYTASDLRYAEGKIDARNSAVQKSIISGRTNAAVGGANNRESMGAGMGAGTDVDFQ